MPKPTHKLTPEESRFLLDWAHALNFPHPTTSPGITGLAQVVGIDREYLSKFLNRALGIGLDRYARVLAYMAVDHADVLRDYERVCTPDSRRMIDRLRTEMNRQAVAIPGFRERFLRGKGMDEAARLSLGAVVVASPA